MPDGSEVIYVQFSQRLIAPDLDSDTSNPGGSLVPREILYRENLGQNLSQPLELFYNRPPRSHSLV